MDLGAEARRYAEQGFEVFPLKPDKTPLTEHGMKDATTDLEQVEAWWQRWPNALIGHRLPAELVIIDIDPRHGGLDTWWKLQEQNGAAPTTRAHLSGRFDGGIHLWFRRPEGERLTDKRLGDGIDLIQRNHRYTILPPSPHPATGNPYTWDTQTDPVDMPAWLVERVTVEEKPVAPVAPAGTGNWAALRRSSPWTTPAAQDSIADWYTEHSSWGQVLGRAGWRIANGDGESDGSGWLHPTATSACSATIRNGCLFVYSPNTPFEVTGVEEPHGYTRFHAFAVLYHGGNQSAAARAARELRDGPRFGSSEGVTSAPTERAGAGDLGNPGTSSTPTTSDNTESTDVPSSQLPEEFWEFHPRLEQIRQAAHSRRRSADAVLHAVLARIAAAAPFQIKLPATVGSIKPLSYYVAIVGPPGAGKGDATNIARELLPVTIDEIPPGSGEGLVETLFEWVEEGGEEGGKPKPVKRQVRYNNMVTIDEGEVLAQLGSRSGSTLLTTLRTIFSGNTLGQANASKERNRIVPAQHYEFGIVMSIQPAVAKALFDDALAGTPQRFGWCSAVDQTLTEDIVEWPGQLRWQPPDVQSLHAYRKVDGNLLTYQFKLAPAVAQEIVSRDFKRQKGQLNEGLMSAHGDLLRLKMAALLALLLNYPLEIDEDTWHIAGIMKQTSDACRIAAEAEVAVEEAQRERAASKKQARRVVQAQAESIEWLVVETAKRIVGHVRRAGQITVRDVRQKLSPKHREVFEDALDHAQAQEWVVEFEEANDGARPSRVLKVVTQSA